GIGASLMMPATLGILSTTFRGSERAFAFSVWGATAGASVAFGPLIGGFLTTDYSWRWAFRINVIVAPLAIIGALLFMPLGERSQRRERIDMPGALLVAVGMFLLVFGLSEGGTYGWWSTRKAFAVSGVSLWPTSRAVSVIPFAFVAAFATLATFVLVERWKERHDRAPLFEFGQLRHRGFRYGLLTTAVLAMGQLGFLFVLPVFLQVGKHLSALENGVWLVPSGLFIVAGSQLGARLTRRLGTTSVVRLGLLLEAVGLAAVAFVLDPGLTFWELLPGFAIFGTGIGFASSQLTNVVLSDISKDKAGAAGGASTTVRQIGAALGIAVIGSLLTSQTVRYAVNSVRASRSLPASLKTQAIARIHTFGVGFAPPDGTASRDVATLRQVLGHAVASGARPALLYAAAVVTLGFFVSGLIPKTLIPKTLIPKTLIPKTLIPKTLIPKTLIPKTLIPKTPR
ncbi:MAG TPA: MFS transporter, partial [Acidimicrobiia bacterium]|nr:MFS transporter [Acidimicrobiia bacterium]